MIAGAVVLIAAAAVGAFALSKSDDTPSAVVVESTDPATTITEPTATDPVDTTSATSPGVTVVNDDTGTFGVLLLDTFQTDTAPLTNEQGTFAQVTGADDLAGFNSDDDHETFGISVLVGDADALQGVGELVTLFDPGDDVCTDRSTKSGYETLNGLAEVLLIDGCGTDGKFSKVVMAIDVPSQRSIILLVTQGLGPSNTDLLDFAQAVGESVVIH
jgi:hypothetical protein